MTESVPRNVVCDAGPLIHLDELDSLDLLADFPRVLLPTSVCEEVVAHRPLIFTASSVRFEQINVVRQVSTELETLARALPLHRGEVDALATTLETPDCWLLTDDTAARLAADRLGLRAHTIGILLRSVRRGMRTGSQVVRLLQAIPSRSSLHIKQSLLEEVIREVGPR